MNRAFTFIGRHLLVACPVMAGLLSSPRRSSAPTRSLSRTCSETVPAGSACGDATPVFRSHTSFPQAAAENAYSRILIGFHFCKSIEEGTDYGRKIGRRATNLYLRPVR
jgi:hypothetical protein